MNPVFQFDSNDPEFNTIYAHELNQYLKEGVDWSAAPFKGASIEDMHQFGADSFAHGWLAYRSQAAQLLNCALPYLQMFANEAKNEHGKNQLLQQVKNIQEFLKVNRANPWKTPYGCPKPEALKTSEEKKAEMLRQLHKSPYGANLGKNWPDLTQGTQFVNLHMPGYNFHVLSVDTTKNNLGIQINPPHKSGVHPWTEDWNLEHTRAAFQRGEYWLAFDSLEEAEKYTIDHLQKNSGSFAGRAPVDTVDETLARDWQAEALKKRQFPAGGVIDFVKKKRKEAGQEIMEDIERKTLDALNGLPKEYEYIPADLYEEYNKNAVALAQLSAQNKRHTLEYKQLADKACELADKMKKVKKEAVEKEAADKMAKMVAGVMQVTDSFVKAAKAIQVFNREAKEAEATRKKFEHMAPKTGGQNPHTGKKYITDEKGFLFVAGNGEILWALHDGAKYCFCEWDGNAWVGWKVEESAVIEAGHTQLPIFLDHFIRSIHPTE